MLGLNPGLLQHLHKQSNDLTTRLDPVLRIRDVYHGSRIRLLSIPDPGSELSPSRILIKEFKYFNPNKSKKWFLSSKKFDPGCSSRIRMLTFSHPGSRIQVGQKGTQSWIPDPDPQHWLDLIHDHF
jgi:hypothetical protein